MKIWQLDENKKYRCDYDTWVWNPYFKDWHETEGNRQANNISWQFIKLMDFTELEE